MKTTLSLLVLLTCFGCSSRSPYDISPDQVKRQVIKGGDGGPVPDLAHLPPGAVKHEKTFKKGETLPDGSIAQGNEHVVTVEVNKAAGPGG